MRPPPSRRTIPPTPMSAATTRSAPPVLRDLEVVDAHDLAAVDVDDLLVEEILDQVERLLFGGRLGRGAAS